MMKDGVCCIKCHDGEFADMYFEKEGEFCYESVNEIIKKCKRQVWSCPFETKAKSTCIRIRIAEDK